MSTRSSAVTSDLSASPSCGPDSAVLAVAGGIGLLTRMILPLMWLYLQARGMFGCLVHRLRCPAGGR